MTDQCVEPVASKNHWGFTRCSRKAVIGQYCRQHDPNAVAARKAQVERTERQGDIRRKEIYGAPFIKALRDIAAGHDNPRALAHAVLDRELGDLP